MHYCLNRDELKKLIDFNASSINVENEELSSRIENAKNWQEELSGLTYLFSKILEKKSKDGSDCQPLIETLYRLEEQMWFYIQECDAVFIEYMLKNIRNMSLSLDEELIELQSNLGNHMYERTLRY
jgi:hypothetical protein